MHKLYKNDEYNVVCNFSQQYLDFKVGAVILLKEDGQWYFAVLQSLTRPQRGFQIVRGTVEPEEAIETALMREIAEEYARPVGNVLPLACNIYNDDKKSDIQVYYVALADAEARSTDTWTLTDGDLAAQELLWRYYPLEGDLSFLSRGHSAIVAVARDQIRDGTLFSD